ncbi:hypothetical protein PHSY_005435 [Pseudozyma hubeiensis SY62]|uniref:Uncharacterized protein n=1 Tax=Pseudozyma hubeiensis (strain SY62) TaxID=1305764 RepID=R9P9E5_PSEHS|nr:hypothetical protein PHSY_005435 [Pseudozyma hubeiensis SY62]GAC97847.1 hypothetical protein PHSY_005435 [Pseudozyma hubeiensis SY62]
MPLSPANSASYDAPPRQHLAQRTASISSGSDAASTEPAQYPNAGKHRTSYEAPSLQPSQAPMRPPRAAARPSADRAARLPRPRSVESLRLDLDGLDLGGNPPFASPLDATNVATLHVRTRSNTAQLSLAASKPAFHIPNYSAAPVDPESLCVACTHNANPNNAPNSIEDSFSLHLREECSDYREILSSQTVLNAVVQKQQQRDRNPSLETVHSQRSRAYSISHGQVLGGFASLGLQTEAAPEPLKPPKPNRQRPARTVTEASTDESESPATPIEWRDSFGNSAASSHDPPPKWAHLTARPCNPLEPLDVLSIEEMGLHSLDVGSLNDWEGCKLSAEILCPINGHQRIEWSVAQTNRRNKKWVVVPNATITCGVTQDLKPSEQAERTVIVSNRSLWLDEAEATAADVVSAHSSGMPVSSQQDRRAAVAPAHRSSMPFSGKAGFELCLLRPTTGQICPPVYLANASTHRFLQSYRKQLGAQSTPNPPRLQPAASGQLDRKAPVPVYPALRRSRSRPYLRQSQPALRRSRSKPYLRASAQRQEALQAAPPTGFNPESFAPSLPGDPLVRAHPGESWPSARVRRSDSMQSYDSDSSNEAGSTTSEDEAGLSATNMRESMIGSASSASYDKAAPSDGQTPAPLAIPIALRASRSAGALRSLSPASSGSRGLSNNSETSAGLAGWQPSSLEQKGYLKQGASSPSYEADSWQSTSPTSASATTSLSASSKQSRSRKGLHKALLKKDKMLSSWFKRRPEHGASAMSVSPVKVGERAQPGPVIGDAVSSQIFANALQIPSKNAVPQSTPLTETALEDFQRAMFRPASPESTIMGSRRGSEALTQKAVDTPVQASEHKANTGSGNRQEVHSALSQMYGWDAQQAASKKFQRVAGGVNAPAAMSFEDLDEECALLGLDAVPAGALTMLIPLPLIGRNTVQDALRYMRVNFVPFKSFSDDFETATAGAGPAASPNSEAEASLSHSMSTSSNQLTEQRPAAGAVKSSEQSSWRRKLGLSSNRNGQNANGNSGQAPQAARPTSDAARASPPPRAAFEPFRITAVVHDAPWTSSSSASSLDPRLPEAGTFPVVLGYCNNSQGLEMVPEGWGALKLAGVPVPTKPDGSPLDGVHPLHGVTDMITSGCVAVMDV